MTMIASIKQSNRLAWLQIMLLRGWLAKAENHLPSFLQSRQPYCLTALEKNKLVSIAIVKPINQRRTCWALSFPEILTTPKECSLTDIKRCLIEKAIQQENSRANSWLMRCPADDLDQVALTREFGFQPLKLLNIWEPPNNTIKSQSNRKFPDGFEWQQLKRGNVQHLWPLENSGESSHLRQILDRQTSDLLNQNHPSEGILFSYASNSKSAIAGLICRSNFEEKLSFEIYRDTMWDQRLVDILPIILDILTTESKNLALETSYEDDKISNLLEKNGWTNRTQELLVGRSLWRRQNNTVMSNKARSLEAILGRLQPQTPPLPTPSLGRR